MPNVVLANASIMTLDANTPSDANAVGIRDDKIAWVGNILNVDEEFVVPHRTIDLAGSTLAPGFIDAHQHVMLFGFWMTQLNCAYPGVASIQQIVTKVADRGLDTPPGEWIRGRGYDDNKLAEGRHVSRHDLDSVSPNHPVILRHASGHMCVVNSFALRQAGIERGMADPYGGHIDVDSDGEPTGLLQETAQALLGVPLVPTDKVELRECLKAGGAAYLTAGITSGHEAGIYDPAEFAVFQQAWADKTLAIRTYMMIRSPILSALEGVGIHTGLGDDMLRVGSIKIISDGSLIGRTAAVCTPFEHSQSSDDLGLAMFSQEELNDLVWRGHSAGWQMAIHAIGDRAVGMALQAYDDALRRLPRPDHRHRIEHAGIMRPDLIEKMAHLRVIPVGQPPFIAEFGDGFLENLGKARCQLTYPLRSYLDAGVPVAGSSDSPVASFHPLIGIQAAVTQKTAGGQDFAPGEALTVEEAFRLYTSNAAYAAFDEEKKGSISVGKYADLVVLGGDPRTIDPSGIAELPVKATLLGGKLVYEASMV